MATISVIVPVYNSEKYLNDCILSIAAQTIEDIEIICVNDGSTDGSEALLQELQHSDSRIHIYSQSNQGVSAARNIGLHKATGEYIAFVDADDFLNSTYFEQLLSAARNYSCEVVVSGILKQQEGYWIKSKLHFNTQEVFDHAFAVKNILPLMIRKDDLNSSCCKLYLRSFLKSNQITFPAEVSLGEDGIFNLHVMCKANRIVFIDFFGYNYREVGGSASKDVVSKDYFSRALEVFKLEYGVYFTCNLIDDIKRQKAIRLIEKVISYTMLYLRSKRPGSYRYVKNMIAHPVVQENVRKYYQDVQEGKTRFEKFLLTCVRYNLAGGLWLAALYSNLRTKI
jgi:glycosyltransferase involved in cell wall biosynthesis